MAYREILCDLIARYPGLAVVEEGLLAAHALLRECFAAGGKLLVAGNGGSAADADHIVGELMKGFLKKRPLNDEVYKKLLALDPERGMRLGEALQGALPAIALTEHSALSTAFANDRDSHAVFAQQVWGYGKAGDVLLCLSTSGNAENLMLAAVTAHAKGMRVVLLTGESGGRLAAVADATVRLPARDTYLVQELQLPVYHALCMMLESDFFEV